ncbi:hypothetical protein F5876DRAFT_72068 [Lentinula aff. lateritia]|uniref:Uncharacterized protein n=1 Tax=Lentinula aff. lateritia TaxID=2804960 RepID=A0ACC1UFB5_9AGAR|nr:hypothetical protein F5876DRAFT_72068 [Lentinula aff. lateritia]
MDELIFTRDGIPIYFALHYSIRGLDDIQAVSDKIWAQGGDILDDDDGVEIILIDPNTVGTSQRYLQDAYDSHPDIKKRQIWIKEMSFVDDCIEQGFLHLEPPPKRAMPGFPPGRGRIAYTHEDDENLCKHLARTLPNPASGGRQSLNFYKQLPKCVKGVYEWTSRHTAQSWREHYKKNQARLDSRIAEIVAREGIDSKALYHKGRLLPGEEGQEAEDEDEETYDEIHEDESRNNFRRIFTKGKGHVVQSEHLSEEEENLEEGSLDEDEAQSASKSHKPKSHGRSEPQHTRADTPDGIREPGTSQTLVNINPPTQPTNQDEEGMEEISAPALEGGLDPEDVQPFTFSLEQLMPLAGVGPDDRVSVDPPAFEDPPYYNTRSRARSRSASVEPLPLPPAPSRKTRKVPEPSQILPPLREASHESESLPSKMEYEHEHDPLFSDSESQSESQPNLQTATNESRKRGRAKDDDESEDDRQVRMMLEKAQNESVRTEPAVATPARGQSRKRTPSLVPDTPARERGRRKQTPSVASESSGSVVPVDGTRASAQKQKRTKEETYNTIFKPIPGTEAARQAGRVRRS